MKFSDLELNNLRHSVKSYISDRRYNHTIGVEEAATHLGDIFLPDRISELRAAALLHDIAKEIPYDSQIQILSRAEIDLTEEDLNTGPALHSICAIPVIREHFALYATPDILSAIKKHTLGDVDMSVFDKIIYIADFTEPGRTYDNCIKTAEYIREKITPDMSYEENLRALDEAILMSVNFTICAILDKKQNLHSTTLKLKNHLENNI